MPRCSVCGKEDAPCYCPKCGNDFCREHKDHGCGGVQSISKQNPVGFIKRTSDNVKTKDIILEYFKSANEYSAKYYWDKYDKPIEQLLEKIRDKHNIPFKIRFVGDEKTIAPEDFELQKDVYGEFQKYWPILHELGNKDIKRWLIDNRGKIDVVGTLAIKIDGKIAWYEFRGDWRQGVPNFLHKILFFGKEAIETKLKIS